MNSDIFLNKFKTMFPNNNIRLDREMLFVDNKQIWGVVINEELFENYNIKRESTIYYSIISQLNNN